MAKRRKYGQTWWGLAWLKALKDVPDENRLARGRTYYSTGRVMNPTFSFEALTLEALVDGAAYYPYEAQFQFEHLGEKERSKIVEAAAGDPAVMAAILDGELPPELLALCDNLGIRLFPRSWRELHPTCSCPDSSPFCKHLAALFYLLLDQIDANPFFVFLTRGIDLQAEMKARGVDLANVVEDCARTVEEVLADGIALNRKPQENEAETLTPEDGLKKLRTLDLSLIPELTGTTLKLLPADFIQSSSDNLRGFISKMLAKAAKSANAALRKARDPQSDLSAMTVDACANNLFYETYRRPADIAPESIEPSALAPLAHWDVKVDFSLELALKGVKPPTKHRAATRRTAGRGKFAFAAPPEQKPLLLTLLAMPPAAVELMTPETECWHHLAKAAAALIAKGALAPTPTAGTEDGAAPRLLWTPAMRDPQTAAVVHALTKYLAPAAETLFENPAHLPIEFNDSDRGEKAAYLALIVAITELIRETKLWEATLDDFPQLLVSSGTFVSHLDGQDLEKLFRRVIRYFRAFLLSDGYPWRPVLTARRHEAGIKINFGILGKDVSGEELEAIAKDASADLPAGADHSDEVDTRPSRARKTRSVYDFKHPVMLKRILSDDVYAEDRFAVLQVLKTLEEAAPLLKRISASKGKPVTLAPAELKEFIFEVAPVLTLLGITLMLPESLNRVLRPRLVASVDVGRKKGSSMLGRDTLANFVWEAAVGNVKLSAEALDELMKQAGGVVRMGDDFVYLDPDELSRLRRQLEEQPQPTYLEKMRAVLMGEYDANEVRISESVRDRLKTMTDITALPPPEGLRATLRPYQERGFSWLMKNLRLGLGALIADDMGLGKTLQVIAALTQLKADGEFEKGRVLAVVPATLMTNWTREIAKFSPNLTTGIYHGADRTLPPPEECPDIVITTYGTLRRDAEILSAYPWRLLVLDEAQAVKNLSSGQSTAVRALKVPQTIAMTGTPVENRLMEYWSILEAVQPKLLGSAKDFNDTFASPIEDNHDEHAAEAFRRLTAPFMLRRLKSDKSIIADLPEKTSIDRFTTLTPEQAALYKKTLDSQMKKIEKLDRELQGDDAQNAKMARRGAVLNLITSLKQICNSPSQYLKTNALTPDSGKGAALLELLSQCREADRKVLIFTQYREMGERLQTWLATATGERADLLHGGVTVKARQAMVDRFQNDRSVRTMIISLKAGGTGLNLTAASAVIHYDLWWNPAVEAQATDRAYRIGQRRDVLVYRFVTAGTFEERINDMLAQKRDLADLTVATGESWIGDLSSAELDRLFELQK